MCARPRSTSDADILAAAFRAIAVLGPTRLTLGDVAAEAGLSPAALVQRFGSKRGLLLAAAADAAAGHAFIFAGLRTKHRSPLAALLGLADCMSIMGATPDQIANSLAFFQLDLTDAEFRRHAVAGAHTFAAGIESLVRDAVAAGELRKCQSAALARTLLATLNGSVLGWALHREGQMVAWVRRDLKTVLDGFRPVK